MEAKYNTGDKKQVVFLQVNKDKVSYLVRKYGVRGFPSFVYVKPNTNANVATKFQDNRTYEEMKEWMEQLLILHGAKPVSNEDDDPVFLSGSDSDELSYQEDDIIAEIISKMQKGEDLDMDEDEDDELDNDGDIQELEIVSIEDVTTGEQIPFKIDGEDY